jgi:hypothetical protein
MRRAGIIAWVRGNLDAAAAACQPAATTGTSPRNSMQLPYINTARRGRRGVALMVLALVAACTPNAAAAQATPAPAPATTAPAPASALLRSPGGDTLAIVRPGAPAEIIGEEGDWLRVRMEGWIHRADAGEGDPGSLGALTLSALRSDPELHRGRVVRWSVQHLALQTADSLRSDIGPGERYLLVRDPGGEPGFVYAVVPPQLLLEAGSLAPLQRVELVARVREGRSSLTGHPLLDLLEIHP